MMRKSTNNIIYLTKAKFLKIDKLARTHAGCPVRIFSPADDVAGDPLGRCQKGNLLKKMSEGKEPHNYILGHNVILIRNQIDYDLYLKPASQYMAIDRSNIPKNMVYEYIVWHEIGHVLVGPSCDSGWNDWPDGIDNCKARRVIDILCDKFALEKLFPNKEVAIQHEKIKSDLDYYNRYKDVFDQFAQKEPPAPITCNYEEMAPQEHASGLPLHNQRG